MMKDRQSRQPNVLGKSGSDATANEGMERPMLGSASLLVLPGHMQAFGGKVAANRSNVRLTYNDNVVEERTIVECDYSDYKF